MTKILFYGCKLQPFLFLFGVEMVPKQHQIGAVNVLVYTWC